MTTARDIIDIAAQAMYTQDAQDSMSGCHWDDLSEGERDDWRRIADAGIAALRDHLTSEDTCRRLTHARMSYYGCTIDQITAAEQPRQHTDACERTEQGWHCYDEHDRSLHPLQDTLDEAAEQIRWVLDQIGTMLGDTDA